MNEDVELLATLAANIVEETEGQSQPDTLVLSAASYQRVGQIARVLWLANRAGRRRSRHCRSTRPRAIRRALERTQ